MNKLIAILTVLILTISTAGCATVTFSNSPGSVLGKGNITRVSFPCGDFTRLAVQIPAELHYTAEKSDTVTIELYENLVEYLDVSNRRGELTIRSTKNISLSAPANAGSTELPKIYISAPVLEGLSAAGMFVTGSFDTITADSFDLKVTGVVSGTFPVAVRELSADMSGAGSVTLTGYADKVEIATSGAGSVNAYGLAAKEAYTEVTGIGSIELSCSEKLHATISGLGGISYMGDPVVTENSSGLGRITRANGKSGVPAPPAPPSPPLP